MKRSYERWETHGYLRPVIDFDDDGNAFETGARDEVVVVFDPSSGREWHVTVEQGGRGRPRITSLMIRGGSIDQAALRQVSLGYLTEAAAGFIGSTEAERDKGAPLGEALQVASSKPGEVHVRDEAPSPETLAAQWNATPVSVIVDGRRIGRRRALADHFGVTVWSIDKYVREARDLGLIDAATTGRRRASPPATQTPDEQGARRATTKKKEQQDDD
ncbi:hypothetical protein GCM10009721_06120 [Terrabacter tumescens]|uniref:Uncharacterized protein n=1 Tax=Terrabacter tumescens TaxID=60443 RepID=A0ABQ2HK29_9MICO|nr:hypothetical protein [Terrabacter tumescens]GGM84172.1 hypothetical protein GCM10009721_06120 [Terrabacter tumescens]